MKPHPFRALAAFALLLATTALSSARDPLAAGTGNTFTEGANSIPYRLYKPDGYDALGSKFPLVIFLHGDGERGTNNTAQVSAHFQGLLDTTQNGSFAAYLFAPQAPTGGQTNQWTNISYPTGSYSNPTLSAPAINLPLQLALDFVDQFIAQNNVDPTRVYITGLSMGGYGTYDAIARRPDLFAAAAPMSGGGNLGAVNTYTNIPIWDFHGDADPTVPVSGSRSTITAIQNGGGTLERYTELAGQGHVIWDPIYNGATEAYDTNYTGTYGTDGSGTLYSWMFAQQKAVPEPTTAALLALGGALTFKRRRRS